MKVSHTLYPDFYYQHIIKNFHVYTTGKSTLLSIIAGLLRPQSGEILLNEEEQEKIRIGYMLQQDHLLEWRTIWKNVLLGPEINKSLSPEKEALAEKLLKDYGLYKFKDKKPGELSGGMKQRVGIARALANDPEVLLMDEPFSALDPLVRQDMQFELLQIQRKLGKTILFITHDINEAFKLGDTVAIMRDGKIVQIDTPAGMSMAPADDYVRAFIESADKANVLSVSSIMATPTCIVREGDDPAIAVREMGREHLSTAYAVDHDMRLLGVVPVDAALQCWREKRPLAEAIQRECVTTSPDVSVRDIMPIAAETRYPIAVVGDDGVLLGIVSRASVLSTMI